MSTHNETGLYKGTFVVTESNVQYVIAYTFNMLSCTL